MDMDLFIVKFWKIHGKEEKSKSISHREEEEVTFWPDFTFYTSIGWRERNNNNNNKKKSWKELRDNCELPDST